MQANTQIALVFDLTGSMCPVRKEVRRNNCKLVESAFRTIPGLEMGVIAVGDDDPRDRRRGYMTKELPLQRDWDKVREFIETVPDACGGDWDECYELALNQLNEFNWNPDANKTVIFFGDAIPHGINHSKNPRHLNWRNEAEKLERKGVTIHSVHCLAHYGETQFWKELARIGRGVYFKLDQFSHVEQLVLGIANFIKGGLAGLEAYENQLQSRNSYPVSVRRNFDHLTGRKSTVRSRKDSRTAIDGSLFQVLTCDASARQDVKEFAVSQGLIVDESHFNNLVKGNLFYAHTARSETLRTSHQVVIQDLETDEMFSDDEARDWLDCPYGESKTIPANPLGSGYTVWIQSKSVNRKIFPGQKVLVKMTDELKDAMTCA